MLAHGTYVFIAANKTNPEKPSQPGNREVWEIPAENLTA